ncbi:AAA family ATPase [Candidatus Bathyarchaeota archaeon]|nr:MAG: AAA family ATPase [Candidatus Bathyarchaeota archaeon]
MAAIAANEAIQLDKHGTRGTAITAYQKAIQILQKLCSLYPNASQNKVYVDFILQYEKRIERLRGYNEAFSAGKSDNENSSIDNLMMLEKPNVTWNDVVGLEIAKMAIEDSIVFPFKRPDLFPLGWPRGILVFGPPGCGKTLIAAATAHEINAAFYNVDAASIMSKWLGESEKNVAYLFKTARRKSSEGRPVIIFMDEIDSLIGIRGEEVGGEVRMRNQFMKEMDSIIDKNKKMHVYIIGATNKPWMLDEPFLRRFQKRIYVPLPSFESRRGIFQLYSQRLFQIDEDVDFDILAEKTKEYSGSDLYDVVQAVHLKIVREVFKSGDNENLNIKLRSITKDDFYSVIKNRKPSVYKKSLVLYEKWDKKLKAL